jgi:hypothetical protein
LFLQDNTAPPKAAITQPKFSELQFVFLRHAACSTDFAPSEYYLFLNLKKHFKGRKFSVIDENTLRANGWFAA